MISTFHKDHSRKLTVMSPPIDSVLPIAKPIAKPTIKPLNAIKRKRGQLAKAFVKKIRKV